MKNYKLLVLGAFVATGFISCELTEKPTSFYEKDTYFESADKAKMAVIGVYDCFSNLSHFGQYEMALPSSDDTYYINGTGTDNTRRDISHYMVKNTNTWLADIWELKYKGIDRANFAIAGIEEMKGYEGDAVLKQYVAEARFLRAFLAFDLIKYWGDVPFKTTYSAGYTEAFQPRTDRETIYDAIIEDLNFAKEYLPKGENTNPETPCQAAAHTMLMRVYLQRAGYSLQTDGKTTRPDDATRTTYFKAVISEWEAMQAKGHHGFYDGGFTELFKSYSAGILNNRESLWEIAFEPIGDSYATNAGVWGTWNGPLVDAPGCSTSENGNFMGRANAFFRVLPCWNDFFEDSDERRDVMVCTYQLKWDANVYNHVKKNQSNPKNWYPGKWRREWMPIGFVNPNNTGVNYCPLRYADAVLMAAEAYNETGNTPTAWNLLNQVRERAGATAITDANYNELMKAPQVYNLPFIDDSDAAGKFRTALFWERGFELAFEGQRKYDLIRWGVLGDALRLFQENIPSQIKGMYVAGQNFVDGKHELFPVPLEELQSNAALENRNNCGY